MLHAVSHLAAVASDTESPLMLFEEMLDAGFRWPNGRLSRNQTQRMPRLAHTQAMLDRDRGFSLFDLAAHDGRAIRLVVKPSRYAGDDVSGYEFADKADAAIIAVATVKSQVDLREIPVSRPRKAEDAGLQEIERHQ